MSARRVLLVEDNQADAILFTSVLEELCPDVDVTVISDGRSALEHVADPGSRPPDLAVFDVNLPRASGFDVLAAARRDPTWGATPVVMYSTSRAESDIRNAYESGASSYLAKPVAIDDAYRTLELLTRYWFDTCLLPGADEVPGTDPHAHREDVTP